jgi:hypothetical protein
MSEIPQNYIQQIELSWDRQHLVISYPLLFSNKMNFTSIKIEYSVTDFDIINKLLL